MELCRSIHSKRHWLYYRGGRGLTHHLVHFRGDHRVVLCLLIRAGYWRRDLARPHPRAHPMAFVNPTHVTLASDLGTHVPLKKRKFHESILLFLSICPFFTPRCSPSRAVKMPFTNTCLMPDGGTSHFSNDALSLIVVKSKVTMSALQPGFICPRSSRPSRLAGNPVHLRMASSTGITPLSRTNSPRRLG